MDLFTLLISVAFYVPFAASIWRWVHHRGALELAVVLVFLSTAALFAVSTLNRVVPSVAPVTGPIAVAFLVAQPVLMLRLATLFVPLPRWVLPSATAGFAASVVAYYATNRSVGAILFLVGYFALAELLAAAVLLREARRRQGLPRLRLATAAAASMLFGISLFTAGVGSAASGGAGAGPTTLAVSRVLALLAGLGYVAAFVPPRWLRDIGHRALAFDLVRAIVASPTGTEPRVLWRSLADAAADILGTRRIRISTEDGIRLAGPVDHGPMPTPSRRAVGPGSTTIDVPLRSEGRLVAVLAADLPGRSLFLEDDLTLIEQLGSLTARAVEREEAVASLAEATRAVAEAEAVRASEARFRALLEAEPNAMLSVDRAGVIRWGTRTAARLFDVPEDELVGLRLDRFVNADFVHHQARGDEGASRFEATASTADGRPFPVEVAITDLEFDGQRSQLVVLSDITWRHETTAMRDRFIGVLSHELRTPITAIYGGVQLLLNRHGLDEGIRRDLMTDVAGESERLLQMVENLLVLARAERGAELTDVGPVMLHRILPEVAARERGLWPALALSVDVPPALPLVSGDQASLSLVLRNLISNAAKYAGPEARVQVTASPDPSGGVAVRVLDDGPGIDASESEQLYSLYFRSKELAAAPGSGIGLFVCRALVEAMGGRTWAASRPEGGAEFGFVLPPYDDDAGAPDHPAAGAHLTDRPLAGTGPGRPVPRGATA